MVLLLISLVAQSSGIPSFLSVKRRVGKPPCRRTAVSANCHVGEPSVGVPAMLAYHRIGEPPCRRTAVGKALCRRIVHNPLSCSSVCALSAASVVMASNQLRKFYGQLDIRFVILECFD